MKRSNIPLIRNPADFFFWIGFSLLILFHLPGAFAQYQIRQEAEKALNNESKNMARIEEKIGSGLRADSITHGASDGVIEVTLSNNEGTFFLIPYKVAAPAWVAWSPGRINALIRVTDSKPPQYKRITVDPDKLISIQALQRMHSRSSLINNKFIWVCVSSLHRRFDDLVKNYHGNLEISYAPAACR